MPDITMCLDRDCPSRKACRWPVESGTIPDGEQQSYQRFERDGLSKCPSFLTSREGVVNNAFADLERIARGIGFKAGRAQHAAERRLHQRASMAVRRVA